ncbi:MAG: transglutaminase domain-containing protein [Promethearchaeota archaeon]|nr:MAG: transglutaminase domain-containing protein [Candidatus Lokiarchaeota archaeon]
MSELKKELLEPAITKKKIIGVIILAGVLIFAFIYSTYAISLIFGTQRDDPSDELAKAEYEDAELLERHFPIDIDDLLDWLIDNYDGEFDPSDFDLDDLEDLGIDIDDIDLDDLAELADLIDSEDVIDFLEEMLDGNIDDFDLTMAGLIIAALLFSDEEAFRVYNYPFPLDPEREDILWKYECFDQFNGDEWISTVPMEQTDYPNIAEPGSDVNTIQRSLSVIDGSNSMVFGSRFNELVNPSIIQDSIVASNLDQTMYYYDELGCSSLDLYFDLEEGITTYNVNMTYNVFGIDLRTNEEINQTARGTDQNPSDPDFQKFLQLPGGVSSYINGNPFFLADWNKLDAIINSNDNAFMVANKIRNYLQLNFDLSFDELVNDEPEDGEDIVYWFCEHDEGLYSEFASAFCAFTRSFGVASRFVDGFNSRVIEEFNDTNDNPYYPIKYKNIYNWAEIFVPWGIGTGRWVQMDILYDTFGIGGAPVGPERYNITVLANSSKYNIFNRNDYVNITAKLNSTHYNVNGLTVTFEDLKTDQVLGTAVTDSNGLAWLLVKLDDTYIVGPNTIEGSVLGHIDETDYLLNDEIRVILENISPAEVNVSETPHTTFIEGYVEDPINSQRIENANVTFLLLYKGTNDPVNVPKPFNPMFSITDNNGRFDVILDVADYNPYGEYDIRVDFNGSWAFNGASPFINDSSDVMDFNITKELTYDINFFINGTPTEYPFGPTLNNLIVAERYNDINLTAIVLDAETKNRVSGILVEFYNYLDGFIGSVVSGVNGNATLILNIGAVHNAGPTLVYAKIGSVTNYSYYIINESISIKINSYLPIPFQLDIAAAVPQMYNITCELLDDKNNFIGYSQIEIKMNRSSIDYSSFITPSTIVNPDSVGSNNFDFERGVRNDTSPNNYSLKLEFNGFFDFLSFPYSAIFNLNYLSNFTYLPNQLQVIDGNQIEIFLSVEDIPTRNVYDQSNQPQIYTHGSGTKAHFQVRVIRAGGAISVSGNTTRIYDDYSNILLESYTYDGSETPAGFVQFNISIDKFNHSGIHRIRVEFHTFTNANFTLIVINETVDISPNLIINGDNEITREIESFSVSGVVKDNGMLLRGLVLRILLLDQNFQNMTTYLIGYQYAITGSDGYFQFDINRINESLIQGLYYIRIDFNGTIYLFGEVPRIDPIQNYMVTNSSYLIPINVTADTYIIEGGYHTSEYEDEYPNYWVNGTTLYVYGTLNWDNTSGIVDVFINISIIKISDNSVIAYNDTVLTIINGDFNGSIVINENWPSYRSETKIIVTFKPINSFNYPDYFFIEETSIEFT